MQWFFLYAVISLFPLYEVDEIMVTATRYPKVLKDIALATVVIDKEEMRERGSFNLGELLHTHAGIDIKDLGQCGVSSISIRGIPSNGTLVLINGHPINSITTGMADLSSIDINGVERIEIIKGPVSSFYGANGLGGVVNIVTIKDYMSPEFELGITPSTTDFTNLSQSQHVFASIGMPLRTGHGGIVGAYHTSDGHRSNMDLNHSHIQSHLSQDFGQASISAVVTYDNKEYGVPGPQPFIDSLHPRPQFGDSSATSLFDREHDKILLGKVEVDWAATDAIHWFTKLFGDREKIDFHSVYRGWLGDTVTEDYEYLTHTIGLHSLAAVTSDNADLIFGLDAHYDTLETAKRSQQTGDTLWHASSYVVGGWIELKKHFGTITTISQIRFDRNSDYGNFVSPGIGIISTVAENFWVKTSLGKAFRAPTFNDLYWPNAGNPSLKPEHGWEYELRLESSPVYNLFAAFSFYLRSIKDRIVWLPTEGSWQPQNANHLSVRGIDCEIYSPINDVLALSLEGTYLNAEQKNTEVIYDFYDPYADTSHTIMAEIERDAAFTPQYQISARLTVKVPHDLAISLSSLWVAEQVNYYPNYNNYPHVSMDVKTLDDYFLMNTNVNKKFFDNLRMSIGIKNLFDVKYAQQFGNSLEDHDYPMPGRTLFTQLVWHYE